MMDDLPERFVGELVWDPCFTPQCQQETCVRQVRIDRSGQLSGHTDDHVPRPSVRAFDLRQQGNGLCHSHYFVVELIDGMYVIR